MVAHLCQQVTYRYIKAFNGTGGELLNVSTDIPDDGEFSVTGGSLSSGKPQ